MQVNGNIYEKLKLINYYIKNSEYKDALLKIKEIRNETNIGEDFTIKTKILESNVWRYQGDFEKAYDIAIDAEQSSKQLKNNLLILDALIEQSKSLYRLGKLDEALEKLKETCEILDLIKDEKKKSEYMVRIYDMKGNIYSTKGELNVAISCFDTSLAYSSETN